MKNSLTVERLKEVLHYDPETGVLTWIKTLSARATKGKKAGSRDKWGYVTTSIDRRFYKAHRLAWLYMTGEWPKGDIDHINGVPGDNRWINLRDVSHAANSQNRRRARCNSRTGVLGVQNTKWGFLALITVHGKVHYLGYHPTIEAASSAYLEAKRKMHEGNTL